MMAEGESCPGERKGETLLAQEGASRSAAQGSPDNAGHWDAFGFLFGGAN